MILKQGKGGLSTPPNLSIWIKQSTTCIQCEHKHEMTDT